MRIRFTTGVIVAMAAVVLADAGRTVGQDTVVAPQALPVWGLSFSPDGDYLAAAAGNRGGAGAIAVWSTDDWSPEFSLEEQHAPMCVAFSPGGETLLVGTESADVVLVDIAEQRVNRRWNSGQQSINGATWTPGGEQLLTAGSDGTIRICDAGTGELTQTLSTWTADGVHPPAAPADPEDPPEQRAIWDLAVSPDGRRLVSGGWGDTTRLWDLTTGAQILSFRGTDELVQGVAFTPDGSHFIVNSQRIGQILVREAETGLESMVFRGGGRDVAIHPDGRLLAVAARERAAVYELKLKVPTDEDVERYLEIIARFEDDDVAVREAASAEVLEIGPPIAPLLFDAIQAPGAETRMRSRRLWNQLRETEPVAEMTGFDGELRQVAFSPDGSILVTAGKGGDVRVWGVPEFEEERVLRVSAGR